MFKKVKGAVMVTILIIMLVISILSVGMIYTQTSNARLLEHQIRRTRAIYAATATMWYVVDTLMANSAYCPSGNDCPGYNPPAAIGDFAAGDIDIHIYPMDTSGGPLSGTRQVDITVDFSQ